MYYTLKNDKAFIYCNFDKSCWDFSYPMAVYKEAVSHVDILENLPHFVVKVRCYYHDGGHIDGYTNHDYLTIEHEYEQHLFDGRYNSDVSKPPELSFFFLVDNDHLVNKFKAEKLRIDFQPINQTHSVVFYDQLKEKYSLQFMFDKYEGYSFYK